MYFDLGNWSLKHYDVVVIGAGAAGLMCALTAGQRGRRVIVLDHANRPGKKILMSGGGRCNFTNLFVEPDCYVSNNPHFCKSALSRYTQYDFLEMVDRHEIPYHEKKLGQLFCDNKAQDILHMLLTECDSAGVEIQTHCTIQSIEKDTRFYIKSDAGALVTESVVIASGGLSIPTMGATGFGYDIAKQFGLDLLPVQPALVPFTLSKHEIALFDGLSGISVDTIVSTEDMSFRENVLFTHRGLSGPAILQISSYWRAGEKVAINLCPDTDMTALLLAAKAERPKTELKTVIAEILPKRLVQCLCELHCQSVPLAELTDKTLENFGDLLNAWRIMPAGTEGYRTAEVTIGGVNTDELSSKTMEAKKVAGLFFIGEVVDVTGHLGGFNFQWAWASGYAAGQYV